MSSLQSWKKGVEKEEAYLFRYLDPEMTHITSSHIPWARIQFTWQYLAAIGTGTLGLYSRQPCGLAKISLTMEEGGNAFYVSISSHCHLFQQILI